MVHWINFTGHVAASQWGGQWWNRVITSDHVELYGESVSFMPVTMVRYSLDMSQVAHQAGAYLQFLQHEVARSILFSTPPGWDTSPSQGYPQHYKLICCYPFIHLSGERHCESKLSCQKNTTQCPWLELKPGTLNPFARSLTMRPPHIHMLNIHCIGINKLCDQLYKMLRKEKGVPEHSFDKLLNHFKEKKRKTSLTCSRGQVLYIIRWTS